MEGAKSSGTRITEMILTRVSGTICPDDYGSDSLPYNSENWRKKKGK